MLPAPMKGDPAFVHVRLQYCQPAILPVGEIQVLAILA
jgi:hypothetical protein